MAKINEGFLNLKDSYLFIEISRRIKEFMDSNPDKPLIRMGIGDVTLPLPPVVVDAMTKASAELGVKETFRGYESSGLGYDFLKDNVRDYYKSFGVTVANDEIFISDGAKSDCGNFTDILSADNAVLVTDPVYPVYVDVNVMGGRSISYVNSTEENGFAAMPDHNIKADLIYLCSPNNPTGSVYTKQQLKEWVDYALKNKAIIIFDAAYEAFISDSDLPRSIFAVEGARECAVEICSFSKTAGFTGTRCGYTVVPQELKIYTESGKELSALAIWKRRQGSKFNGVSYPVQRAAAAAFSPDGIKQTREIIDYYMENARIMSETFEKLGISYTGGKNSPYIWFRCPNNLGSWEFFDLMMKEIQVVGTPGEGFGKNGDGWFRLTAFNTKENTIEAMARFTRLCQK